MKYDVKKRRFTRFTQTVMFLLLVSLVVASDSSTLCAATKQEADKDDEYDFMLVNNSGSTFSKIWLSHSAELNWTERNRLKLSNGRLESGESMQVKLPRNKGASYLSARKGRYYDIRVELPNGKATQWRKIDFATVYKIEITKKGGNLHLTRFVP